jgi:Protein of unknown function (DUF2795)
MPAAVTADEVLRHLGDVDHPADEDTLVASAERAGAPEEVVKSFRAVPPGFDHRNRDEVVRSLRLDPGASQEPGDAARYDSKPRIAQSSRDPQHDRVTGEDRRNT